MKKKRRRAGPVKVIILLKYEVVDSGTHDFLITIAWQKSNLIWSKCKKIVNHGDFRC